MKQLVCWGFWLVALLSGAAQAAPVLYHFQFTPSTGPTPTGRFTYDDTAALNNRFSEFTVTSEGLVVDFTSIANLGIDVSVGGCSPARTSAVLFSYLSGACGARAYELFDFGSGLGGVQLSAAATPGFSQLGSGVTAAGAGAFSVSAVPEPHAAGLVVMGLLAVAAMGQRRRKGRV